MSLLRKPMKRNPNFPFGGKDKKSEKELSINNNNLLEVDEKIMNESRPKRTLKRKNES